MWIKFKLEYSFFNYQLFKHWAKLGLSAGAKSRSPAPKVSVTDQNSKTETETKQSNDGGI